MHTDRMRLLLPTMLGGALFLVWVYAILDIIATEPLLARTLPKLTWLFLTVLVPGVGAIAWLALGRPVNAGWYPGDTAVRARPRVVGPEDRPDWVPHTRSSPPHRQGRSQAAHPAGKGGMPPGDPAGPSESSAARERRLTEWEAELARRQAELDPDD